MPDKNESENHRFYL